MATCLAADGLWANSATIRSESVCVGRARSRATDSESDWTRVSCQTLMLLNLSNVLMSHRELQTVDHKKHSNEIKGAELRDRAHRSTVARTQVNVSLSFIVVCILRREEEL